MAWPLGWLSDRLDGVPDYHRWGGHDCRELVQDDGVPPKPAKQKLNLLTMFWAIFVILLVLWALGLICHIAFSHVLLVIAFIVLIVRLVRGRAP